MQSGAQHQITPTVRLRQACDSCTAAKVKCDKGRPACQRCLDAAQVCQYSASQRYGKRTTKKAKAAASEATQQKRPSLSTTQDAAFPYVPAHEGGTCDTSLENNPVGTNLDDDAALIGIEPTSALPSQMDLDSLCDWTAFDLPMEQPLNGANYGDAATNDQWMRTQDFTNGLGERRQQSHSAGGNLMSRPGSLASSGVTNRQWTGGSGQYTDRAMKCESRAMSVLRSLHYSPILSSAGSSGARSSTAGTPTLSRSATVVHSVDLILSTNKTALSDLMQMLDYQHAEDPHVAMVHMTILSKVIFWYKVAVTSSFYSEKVELRPIRIQLGSLELDDEDHATLHRTALRQELCKASGVLQEFEDHIATSDTPGNTKAWRRLAVGQLREDLQRIIEKSNDL